MFEEIIIFINKYIQERLPFIQIISNNIHGNNKLEYALSNKDLTASISILSDLTYDFFAIENDSKKIVSTTTNYFQNIDELLNQLRRDLDNFARLKRL